MRKNENKIEKFAFFFFFNELNIGFLGLKFECKGHEGYKEKVARAPSRRFF